MAYLSLLDVRTISDAFNHGSGYVMDFTTPEFDRFFRQEVGVAIDGAEFRDRGDSKGKRFASFLDKADEAIVHRALSRLWAYRVETGWKVDWKTPDEEAALPARFEALLARLAPGGPARRPAVDDLEAWHRDVTARVRAVQAIAFATYENTLHDDGVIPPAARQEVAAQVAALAKALPEDFPASAIHDMARHAGFCEAGDLRDIAIRDAVDVQQKADRYLDHHRATPDLIPEHHDGRRLIAGLFREAVEETAAAQRPDYHMLVLKCCLLLGREFGLKTGLEDDLSSYGKAFNLKEPVLMVPPSLDSDTHRSMQQGAMFLFQGYRAFLRNTHAHDIKEGDRDAAMQAVVFLSILTQLLDAAERVR